jgi:hypothetical protein
MATETHFWSPFVWHLKPILVTICMVIENVVNATKNESRWQPKNGFNHLPIGDRKWVLILIQEILIIRWQLKMGFGHHSKNLNRWMAIENRF